MRNEIKAHIVQAGTTMSEVVRTLAAAHSWSASVPNLSDKLKRGTNKLAQSISEGVIKQLKDAAEHPRG